MKELKFKENTNLSEILKIIKEEPESELLLFAPNLYGELNKKVIALFAQENGKRVHFKGEAKGAQPPQQIEDFDFVEGKDVAEEQNKEEAISAKTTGVKTKKKLAIPIGKFAKLLLIPLVVLVIFGIASLGFILWIPSANIIVFTSPQFKEAEITLIASEAATEKDDIVPIKILENSQSGSLEKETTGNKTIGTPAKGRVKIVNRDDRQKIYFAHSTILKATGSSVTFKLDKDVTIPAATPPDVQEVGVDVTAVEIGPQGNLPAGTAFEVNGEIKLVFAEAIANFTGGSSKEVKVVSSQDQTKAKEELLKKLQEKAFKEIKDKNADFTIPEGGVEVNILKEVYSKKVDEEASSFSLNLEVKFMAKAFEEKSLKDSLIKSIQPSVPSGFEIDKKNSIISSEILEKTDDGYKILGKIKAYLIPIVNDQEVKRNVAGKSFSEADQYLKSLQSIQGFEIRISPSFYSFFRRLPYSKNKITIEVRRAES